MTQGPNTLTDAEAGGARPSPWIPIRALAPQQRWRVGEHLLALPAHDRHLRFGHAASDAQIQRYVDGLDFGRDEVFGIFNHDLLLIAQAHLAYPSPGAPGLQAAEFGVSVLPQARGRGYGARLFAHAVLHARNRGLDTLYIHALSENTTMLGIARRAGAAVVREGSEAQAYLRLPHNTLASQMEQWVGEGAAAIDYGLKKQALRVDRLLAPREADEPPS
jgi:GNAT superfamily N-acetyltransferase